MPDGRGPKLAPLELTAAEREELQSLARRLKTAQALAMRARIVLACADGLSNSEVSRRLSVSLPTIGKWRGPAPPRPVTPVLAQDPPGGPRLADPLAAAAALVESLVRQAPTH